MANNNPQQNLDGAFLLSLLQNPQQAPSYTPVDPTNPFLFHPHWGAPPYSRPLDFLPNPPPPLENLPFPPLGLTFGQLPAGGPHLAPNDTRGSSSRPPPGFGNSAGSFGAEFTPDVGEQRQFYSKQVQGFGNSVIGSEFDNSVSHLGAEFAQGAGFRSSAGIGEHRHVQGFGNSRMVSEFDLSGSGGPGAEFARGTGFGSYGIGEHRQLDSRIQQVQSSGNSGMVSRFDNSGDRGAESARGVGFRSAGISELRQLDSRNLQNQSLGNSAMGLGFDNSAEFTKGAGFRSAAIGEHRQVQGLRNSGMISEFDRFGVQGQRLVGLDGIAGGGDRVSQGWNQTHGIFGEELQTREVQSENLRSFSEKLAVADRNKSSVGLEDEDCDGEEEIVRRMRVLDVAIADEHGSDSVSCRKDNLVKSDGFEKQMEEVLEATAESVSRHMGSSRGKDFRSDFSRGYHVSNQRIRIQRRTIHCRHDIDAFAPSFLSIFRSLVPAEEEKAKHKHLLTTLGKLINKEWPNAKLYLYGSCANSFGVSNSDIDLCLSINDMEISKPDILLKLADILQSGNLEDVQALTRARVPIVKLKDPVTGLSCDICINNLLAVVNTKLLRDYALIDVRLRQLAFIVKHWAKSRSVNETYQGTLSSYAYVLMCIHFLQLRRPAILPCLQALEPTYAITVDNTICSYFDQVEKLQSFGSRNKESISRLVWAFFQYWAYYHDYTNDVISVRTGTLISKHAKDWTRRIGNDRHLICIEDPFEISHDLGRVVDKFSIKILREEFERAANILQFDPNPSATLFEPYVRDTAQN